MRGYAMAGLMSLFLFVAAGISLLAGFPVAFSLAGVALVFALLGIMTGTFDAAFLHAFPSRIFGIMSNETLIAGAEDLAHLQPETRMRHINQRMAAATLTIMRTPNSHLQNSRPTWPTCMNQ